jgi:hypothetical protein
VHITGALLAVGILNSGVQHENDPAYALLYDFVEKHDPVVRIGAIMGLGLAYAGTQKEEVRHPRENHFPFLHLPDTLHACAQLREREVPADKRAPQMRAPVMREGPPRK